MYYYNLNFYIVSFVFCFCIISFSIIKGIEVFYKIKFYHFIANTRTRSYPSLINDGNIDIF